MSLGSEYISESYANEVELRMEIEKSAANGIWTTRDGKRIRIIDMSEDHIKNTINYIRKNDSTDMMLPWVTVFQNELKRRHDG